MPENEDEESWLDCIIASYEDFSQECSEWFEYGFLNLTKVLITEKLQGAFFDKLSVHFLHFHADLRPNNFVRKAGSLLQS